MKRGFLNSTGGRAALGANITPTAGTSHRGFLRASSNISATEKQIIKLPYGVVENAGVPADYVDQEAEIVWEESDPRDPSTPDDLLLMAMLPNGNDCAECLVTAYVKRKILKIPGFPKQVKQPDGGPGPGHVIQDTPTMGKGMFATRDFKRGDLIIDERPILITPKAVPVIPITPAHYTLEQALQVQIHEYEKLLKALVNRLRADKKAAFMSLANSHEHDGSGPIYGRIRTNAFGMPNLFRDKGSKLDSPVGAYSGVWDNLSRMNHSCCPNTSRSWCDPSFSFQIRACRNIKAGEQLTCAYGDLLEPYEQRKRQLAPYGVDCTCPACLDPTVSDKRRRAIAQPPIVMAPLVPDRVADPNNVAWLEPVIALVRDMEHEGVQDADMYSKIVFQALNGLALMADKRAPAYGKLLYLNQKAHQDFDNVDEATLKNYCTLEGLKKAMPQYGLGKMMMDAGKPFLMVLAAG